MTYKPESPVPPTVYVPRPHPKPTQVVHTLGGKKILKPAKPK